MKLKENDTKKLTITIAELSKLLGISRGLGYELARQNKLPLPVIRLGRRMVVSQNSVNALLETGEQVIQKRVNL